MLHQTQARTISGRIRFLGASLLELPRSLLASLRDLTTDIGWDDPTVGEALRALVRELDKAVASYRGLQLTIVSNGSPVVLTAFTDDHDDAPLTSLRVPLVLLDSRFAAGSRVVFYASTPGAFVDLAADLAYALGRTQEVVENLAPPAIPIDADLPPLTRDCNLAGATELLTIDRAVGVMIDHGHHPDRAHATLRSDAARAGMEPYAWAARILQRTSSDRPDG